MNKREICWCGSYYLQGSADKHPQKNLQGIDLGKPFRDLINLGEGYVIGTGIDGADAHRTKRFCGVDMVSHKISKLLFVLVWFN